MCDETIFCNLILEGTIMTKRIVLLALVAYAPYAVSNGGALAAVIAEQKKGAPTSPAAAPVDASALVSTKQGMFTAFDGGKFEAVDSLLVAQQALVYATDDKGKTVLEKFIVVYSTTEGNQRPDKNYFHKWLNLVAQDNKLVEALSAALGKEVAADAKVDTKEQWRVELWQIMRTYKEKKSGAAAPVVSEPAKKGGGLTGWLASFVTAKNKSSDGASAASSTAAPAATAPATTATAPAPAAVTTSAPAATTATAPATVSVSAPATTVKDTVATPPAAVSSPSAGSAPVVATASALPATRSDEASDKSDDDTQESAPSSLTSSTVEPQLVTSVVDPIAKAQADAEARAAQERLQTAQARIAELKAKQEARKAGTGTPQK